MIFLYNHLKMHPIQKREPVSIIFYDFSYQNEWNSYILESPHSVFAHHLGWKNVIEETYKHRSFYLMGYRDNKVVGILPLFLIKSLLFGNCMVTSPFLTFGGIVSDDETVTTALIDKAIEIAHKQKVNYIEIRNEKQTGYLPHTKSIYYTLLLDLSSGIDTLWNSSLHSSTRRNILKAYQSGLVIEEGHDHLKHFVDINAQNMHRLGTPSHCYHFFYNILKHFPQSTLIMVRSEHTYIGGMLLVYYKDTVLMPWVASLQSYFHLKPNNLLYWEAITRAVKKGYRYFDFGRSKWDSGTFRFKSQFGAKPVQIHYQYYLNTVQKVPDLDPENPVFRTLISIWKKLPLSVTKLIGHRIIRYIP